MKVRLLRRLSLPSPALVIAVAALVAALSGSSHALTITNANVRDRSLTGTKFQENSVGGNAVEESALSGRSMRGTLFELDSVGGNAVKESTLGTVPSAAVAGIGGGLARHAVIAPDGAIVRQRGIAGSSRIGPGHYQVAFDVDVRACVYVATIGDELAGGPGAGEINVAQAAANVNAVRVVTRGGGNRADRSFHIVVSC